MSKKNTPTENVVGYVVLIVIGFIVWVSCFNDDSSNSESATTTTLAELGQNTTRATPAPPTTRPTTTTQPTTTTRRTTTTISQREIDDTKFWSLIDRRQVDGSFDWLYPDDLVRVGRAVCQDLRDGRSVESLLRSLAAEFTWPDAEVFLLTAGEVFCPEFY